MRRGAGGDRGGSVGGGPLPLLLAAGHSHDGPRPPDGGLWPGSDARGGARVCLLGALAAFAPPLRLRARRGAGGDRLAAGPLLATPPPPDRGAAPGADLAGRGGLGGRPGPQFARLHAFGILPAVLPAVVLRSFALPSGGARPVAA